MYSKTCVKRPLSKRPKMFFKTKYHLMQVKSIAECSPYRLMQVKRIAECSKGSVLLQNAPK